MNLDNYRTIDIDNECMVNDLVRAIDIASRQHAPGTNKPVYTKNTFFPKMLHDCYNKDSGQTNFSIFKYSECLEELVPIVFRAFKIIGQAGSGKTHCISALKGKMSFMVTTQKRELVQNAHNSIKHYNTDQWATLSKHQMMTIPHNCCLSWHNDPRTRNTYKETYLDAILYDTTNLLEQLENLKSAIIKIASTIDANYTKVEHHLDLDTTTLSAKPSSDTTAPFKCKRKLVSSVKDDTIVSQVTNEKYTSSRSCGVFCNINNISQIVGRMSRKALLALCTSLRASGSYMKRSTDITDFIIYNKILIEEAGTVDYVELIKTIIIMETAWSLLGINSDVYPVVIASGSTSQTSAIRSVSERKGEFVKDKKKETASALDYLNLKYIVKETLSDLPGRTIMFHVNKRNASAPFRNAVDKLNLGIFNEETVSVFDNYLLPLEHILDPNVEIAKMKKYGDSYIDMPIDKVGAEKLDTRNYRRIFADSNGVANYIKRCEDVFESKKCRVNIFLNVNEADCFMDTVMKETSGLEHFIKEYLANNEIQEVTNLTLKQYGIFTDSLEFEMEDEYWPCPNCPIRNKYHITYPLLKCDWKLEEEDTVSSDSEDEYLDNTGFYYEESSEGKSKRKRKRLDIENYPMIKQKYKLYYSDVGILIGKTYKVMRPTKFIITGFKGILKKIKDMVIWFSDTQGKCSSKFVLIMFAKMFNVMLTVYSKYTDRSYLESMPDTNDDTLQRWFEVDALRHLRDSPQTYNDIFQTAVKDINELYMAIEQDTDTDEWQYVHVNIYELDLINNTSSDKVNWNNSYRATIPADTQVVTENVVDINLNNDYIMSLSGQFSSNSIQARLLEGIQNVYGDNCVTMNGIVVNYEKLGITGILIPNSVIHATQKQQNEVSFCLAMVTRVPIRSDIATTIAMCQGQTIKNVALVVKDFMLLNQKSFFVGCTRHTDNFVCNRNGAKECRYEPQHDIMDQMLSETTRHVY